MILYLIGFGKNHLWYLEALFIIFVLTYACNSIFDRIYENFRKEQQLL